MEQNSVYFLDVETVYLLQTYGSSMIQSVQIASTPIRFQDVITPALHVYLIVNVGDVSIVIEKNERTELSLYTPRSMETVKTVQMNSSVTLSECLHRTIRSMMDERFPMGHVVEIFWGRYNLEINNCQQLVFRIIRSNGWDDVGLESFNQGAEQFKSIMQAHMTKTEAPPLAKLISSLFLQYVSNVTAKMVSQRIRDTPAKESTSCMTIDCVHIETFTCSPEEACEKIEEMYIAFSKNQRLLL
jgi:hypothetical protein